MENTRKRKQSCPQRQSGLILEFTPLNKRRNVDFCVEVDLENNSETEQRVPNLSRNDMTSRRLSSDEHKNSSFSEQAEVVPSAETLYSFEEEFEPNIESTPMMIDSTSFMENSSSADFTTESAISISNEDEKSSCSGQDEVVPSAETESFSTSSLEFYTINSEDTDYSFVEDFDPGLESTPMMADSTSFIESSCSTDSTTESAISISINSMPSSIFDSFSSVPDFGFPLFASSPKR